MPTLPHSKVCRDCQIEKPVNEFYLRTDGRNYTSVCIECMKVRGRYRNLGKMARLISTVDSENQILSELHQLGIPAWPGKAMSHTWADMVAWGIVRIEVKSAIPNEKGVCSWHFTPSQLRNGIRGDVVILIRNEPTGPTYFILRQDSPVFYLEDGDRKSAIIYPLRRWASRLHLNDLIEASVDHWQLINQVRDELCLKLQSGQYDVTKRN